MSTYLYLPVWVERQMAAMMTGLKNKKIYLQFSEYANGLADYAPVLYKYTSISK